MKYLGLKDFRNPLRITCPFQQMEYTFRALAANFRAGPRMPSFKQLNAIRHLLAESEYLRMVPRSGRGVCGEVFELALRFCVPENG